jgi:hypothetical protein
MTMRKKVKIEFMFCNSLCALCALCAMLILSQKRCFLRTVRKNLTVRKYDLLCAVGAIAHSAHSSAQQPLCAKNAVFDL